MKKLAVLALSLFLALNLSQANTIQVQKTPQFRKHSELKTRTVTKSVLALAISRSHRKLLDIDDEDDGPPGPDELDLQSPYARPRVSDKKQDATSDISDYATVRLAVARTKALAKYRSVWT